MRNYKKGSMGQPGVTVVPDLGSGDAEDAGGSVEKRLEVGNLKQC